MFNIRPTLLFLKLLGLLILASIVQLFYPEARLVFVGVCVILGVIFCIDLASLYLPSSISLKRIAPQTVPVGVPAVIKIELSNLSNRHLNLEIFDHYPTEHKVDGLSIFSSIASGKTLEHAYKLTPLERGLSKFKSIEVRALSVLSFWHRYSKYPAEHEMKVYPNYSEVMKYGLLAAEQRLSQMGIHKKRHRGVGTDFQQLRDFRKGDRLGDIDWKTSARLQKLIAKDYQIERDQQVFFLVDCGRRMRSLDGELSHFDHALNAMLLLTYVASKQGDAVGMMTFAGEQRWLGPKKSTANVNRFLKCLYDLKPTTKAADFTKAAQDVNVMLKKRALVIVLSNLRDEDDEDLLKSLKLLRQKHLVVFAALKEEVFEEEESTELTSYNGALKYAALNSYMLKRQEAFEKLSGNKIISMDVAPSQLHVELVNRYYDIKSSNLL
ncbi:MAG: DUF58 domain-containing protein [Lentisphaeraceae bacterium]|nr:DUF58 domain-containing protein [Lentisphaeraceae bacterium]